MSRKLSSILVRSIQSCRSQPERFLFSKTHQNQDLLISYLPRSTTTTTTFLSSKQHYDYARFSTLRKEPENRNLLQVEIISKEFIKPLTPTPQPSRTYNVSLFDQLFPHFYLPFVYFYQHNHQNQDSESLSINHEDLILKRKQLLKQSLSETLTKFYPLAGRVKDSTQIDCNDDGVYYVEAKVSNRLSDFLDKPDNHSIHQLLPFHPTSTELQQLTHLVIVQVTTFSCGGISIGIFTSHKIIDGSSISTFVKAWAERARDAPEKICPSFVAPSIFPSSPALSGKSSLAVTFSQYKVTTRRVVFSSSSLATLKERGRSSRAMGAIGFLLKCAMAAYKARSDTTYTSIRMAVSLRKKMSPPMPPYSIGNIFWNSFPVQFRADEELGLESIVQRMKDGTDKLNEDFVEETKGEEFPSKLEKSMNAVHTLYSDKNGKHMTVTSTCNIGLYETDFGWGRPIWISFGYADTNSPNHENCVLLMDTRSGNGMEAWVFLSEHDMAVFECDPELLALASVNPSPLQNVD